MRIACAHERDRPLHSADLARGRQALHRRERHRVPVRAVRGHARQAERQARACASVRRPDGGRRRLRRVRRRRDRPVPARPGPRGHAGRAQLHAACLEARRGAARVRRSRGGRGVALLPAHDPPPSARPRERARLRVQGRRRARVLPRTGDRGRRNRAGGSARPARPALLRHARPHPQPRLRLTGGAQPHGPAAGTTTPPTTRTRTGSSSRTSTSRTRSPRPTARSSSVTWSSRSRRSAG